MDVLAKLPSMADDALNNLHANAARLEQTGSKTQRTQAAELLPAILAELSARKAAKLERAAKTRRDASESRSRRKAAATAANSA